MRSPAGEKNRSKDRPLEKRTQRASGGRYKHKNEAKNRRILVLIVNTVHGDATE